MESDWNKVTQSRKCPVCGRPDWCLISKDGSAVICPRIDTGATKYIDGSGYLHVIGEKTKANYSSSRPAQLPSHNHVMKEIHDGIKLSESSKQVIELADLLGVQTRSLVDLEIGWSESKNSYAFPMKRRGNQFLGIRFRSINGSKFSAKGSKQGLFIPASFSRKKGIVVCEGPTDTAAMLSVGMNAVGLPSCSGGTRLAIELAAGIPVVVIADNDEPGRKSADRLVKGLKKAGSSQASVVYVDGYKDAREWYNNGLNKQELLEKIKESKCTTA